MRPISLYKMLLTCIIALFVLQKIMGHILLHSFKATECYGFTATFNFGPLFWRDHLHSPSNVLCHIVTLRIFIGEFHHLGSSGTTVHLKNCVYARRCSCIISDCVRQVLSSHFFNCWIISRHFLSACSGTSRFWTLNPKQKFLWVYGTAVTETPVYVSLS